MTTSSQRKGRNGENRVHTYLDVNGYLSELVRLGGDKSEDRGDLWLPVQTVREEQLASHRLEVKNHKNVLSAINQATAEAHLLAGRFPLDRCVGVVARPGKPVMDWYVVQLMQDAFPPNPEL